MNRTLTLFTIFCITLCSPVKSICQNNDIEFTICKIVSEYPGFKQKTKNIDFERWAYSIAKSNANDTFKALSVIVNFFNDQHLRIGIPGKRIKDDSGTCRTNKQEIFSYLNKGMHNPREGFWMNDYNNCVIGLREDSAIRNGYVAIVIESSGNILLPGSVIMKMERCDSSNYITEFRSPHNGSKRYLNAHFRSDSIFTTAAESKWKKITNYHANYLASFQPKSDAVSGEKLNASTYLVRIPISLQENVRRLDSILKKDSTVIASCKNLIIDNRRNVGGTGAIARPLYPWIYTDPIVRVCARIYVTENEVKNYLEEIEKLRLEAPFTPEEDSFVIARLAEFQENMGGFLKPYRDTVVFNEVRHNPQKVGLIIDYGVQSAGELLTMNIRHSSKVTTFGERTIGAVDYLDFYPIETPSKKYRLFLPTTQRVFEEGEEIDGKGIEPDVPLYDSMPDWIDEVGKYLNRNTAPN